MSNVISLFLRSRLGADAQVSQDSLSAASSLLKENELKKQTLETNFQAIAERNAEIQERMRRERGSANKGVLKSYRIK